MTRSAALSVFLVLALPAAVPRRALAPPIPVTCTLVNPAYAGDCVEKTTREEKEKAAAACQPILDCLNNARCVKTYCQSTTVRQGWTLKSATEEKR
jgi:hypothetical protein